MAKASLGRTRPESLTRLLLRQYSVISLTQAKGLGLSMSTVHYRIRPGGPWQQVLPGVYLTVSGQPTIDQLDMAASSTRARDPLSPDRLRCADGASGHATTASWMYWCPGTAGQ